MKKVKSGGRKNPILTFALGDKITAGFFAVAAGMNLASTENGLLVPALNLGTALLWAAIANRSTVNEFKSKLRQELREEARAKKAEGLVNQ